MSDYPGTRQRGVALLQVLLLSMVISLLLLQLVYTARGQLAVASEVEQRVRADLLLYSARNEAIFASLVTPDSLDRDALSLVNEPRVRQGRMSNTALGFSVNARLHDISGLLPLRFPKHPLWPGTLVRLGMERDAAQRFLEELKHMQDLDFDGSDFSREPQLSGSGFTYPNIPLQMPNSIGSWVTLDPDMRQRIESVSHHYMQDTVNFMAAPDSVVRAALGGYGTQIADRAEFGDLTEQLKFYLDEKYPYWVDVSNSGLWRLEVAVEGDMLARRARYDFRVSIRSDPPFDIVGN